MTTLTTLADRLSGLTLRLRSTTRGRLGRRRADRRWQPAAGVLRLEERAMLSLDGIALPVPTDGFAQPDKVMSQELIGENKTITIYNNSDAPIFPIIEANNTGQNPDNNNAYYDPYDPHGRFNKDNAFVPDDYRLYPGYYETVGGTKQYFLGIPAGASITVTLPIALWDAGTIQVVADTPATRARFLETLSGTNQLGRPFLYNGDDKKEAVVDAPLTGSNLGDAQGMELLYHSNVLGFSGVVADAPSQLLEYTIRDQEMPQTPTMNFTNTVDYDISSINNVYLPVAVVANKAGIGYIGTVDDLTTFEGKVKDFADGSILNGYYGGMGSPIYYTSDPAKAKVKVKAKAAASDLLKLVGTKNIFSDNTAASSYNLLQTMLSSSAGNEATHGVLKPTNGDYAEKDLANLWFGWLNYYAQTTGTLITGNLLKLEQQTQIPLQPVTITPDPNQTWTTESGTISDSAFAQSFADTVYNVMNAYSTASNISFSNPALPALRTFMADIIGNTISLVYPDVTSKDAIQLTQGNVALQQGEPNTDVQAAQGLLWPGQQNNYALPLVNGQYVSYPAPAGPTASADQWAVGKYNLDPFVWFVHSYLQAYEYAFSVDDRYGNIEVPDATGFTITVGGPNGIPPGQLFPYGTNPN